MCIDSDSVYSLMLPQTLQFDALIERLTGRELLTMFARLRGVPESQIKEVVDTEITRVDLKKHANKKCGSYRSVNHHLNWNFLLHFVHACILMITCSGGNKRKLSTAIALVGNPPIVLLVSICKHIPFSNDS